MKEKIKAVFFDLDGTLVDKKTETIPQSTQDALKMLQCNGIKVFIASGRPPIWAAYVREQFEFVFDGKVLFNGQYCVDASDVPFYRHPLTNTQCCAILDWMQDHPSISCNFMESDYVYSNFSSAGNQAVEDPARCLNYDTYQISPQIGPELDEEILRRVPGIKSARWNDSSTDLIPGDGGKSVGMEKMLEHFGLHRNQCMAFGDGANDIEMLQYAAIGVAMGNGTDEVKQAADYVTDPVDGDGIHNALRHFGLIS
ncbi:Cof-type HAD-IIB family hydrolase [Lactonifactor sp. BIOML-A3]|uniref:Cof-type HAD-IIB family hydrolase n=1 Tax=unclassified Lactonifactor TaxID=2636670 RepID=UPI0012B00F09|nr:MULTISPECIES: Cof-type HAD-IIB family hydrolase [unclassified Lactonifactor]MSA02015.1 Cof-type HAD-IIB family hydrolase [Lactonifactor sp. BIOML-A5]MSA08529.1 Cof-type HAD-IIB family hydrolase [Lactonifactor sp. BIOML-A4]MSA12902.1 Cof-type HAD-IIB family hydrolase [Lactonifactor sp. BIOML-A3]MSA17596.1 Cof-type HAD-IIB family hydrolase [Lactonifactor sp. BIOML-A2]MSA37128.1 Cof-type HAD-IIB family hydrolase [Lactonifactor sp. BIOML-A1]